MRLVYINIVKFLIFCYILNIRNVAESKLFAIKSYLRKLRVRAILVSMLCVSMICTSCSSDGHNYLSKSSDELVKGYRAYYQELKAMQSVPKTKLPNMVADWRTRRDTLNAVLSRDTVQIPHTDMEGEFRMIHDSIRTEMLRLTRAHTYTYTDVVAFKEASSSYIDDEDLKNAAKEAEPFFSSLDKLTAKTIPAGGELAIYQRYLNATIAKGIHSRDDMLSFIKGEDMHFRNFLLRLSELSGNKVSEITQATERCCMLVFKAANKKEISFRDALVYMTMRTNRRVLLNSQACIKDIRDGHITDDAQAKAYFYMLLQPYISIDQVGIATFTTSGRRQLMEVADAMPQMIIKLNSHLDIRQDRLERMPSFFVEAIILSI